MHMAAWASNVWHVIKSATRNTLTIRQIKHNNCTITNSVVVFTAFC